LYQVSAQIQAVPQPDWPEVLPIVTLTYNTSQHAAI